MNIPRLAKSITLNGSWKINTDSNDNKFVPKYSFVNPEPVNCDYFEIYNFDDDTYESPKVSTPSIDDEDFYFNIINNLSNGIEAILKND